MSGLYINTNVNSMIAATNLTNSMNAYSDTLTRLSTGLRINSAKDDPAGLIASEALRSEITASTAALKNTQRANSMIATADSALSQVGDLLNDIRGLINEAANTGAMSAEQIEANQLQIDATLDAIDRIAISTTYMGKKLLDGSLSFQTSGLNSSEIADLSIYSANFGNNSSMGVTIDVQAPSTVASQVYTQGALGSDGASFKVTGSQGSQVFNFGAYTTTAAMAEQINAYSDSTGVRAVAGNEATAGIINITSAGTDNDIVLTATTAGEAAGNYSVKYTAGSSSGITYQITEGTDGCATIVDFQLQTAEAKNASGIADESSLGIYDKSTASGLTFSSTTGSNVKQVNWVLDGGTNTPTAVFDNSTGIMTISYDGTTPATSDDVIAAVNAVSNLTGVTVAETVTGTPAILPTANTVESTTDLRANNGLTVTSKTGGDSMNDTGVVIVGNVAGAGGMDATEASVTISDASDGITLTAKETGTAANDYKITFVTDSSATAVSAAINGKEITVTGNFEGTTTWADVETAMTAVTEITDIFDVAAVTGSDPVTINFSATAYTSGGQEEIQAIEFNYVDTAQAASAVIRNGEGGDYLQFKATEAGSDYNGYTFKFASDAAATGVSVSINETDKVITINGNFEAGNTTTLAQVRDAVNNLKNSEGKQIFQMDVYLSDPTNNTTAVRQNNLTKTMDSTTFNAASTTSSTETGTKFGQIGTDAGALVVVMTAETAADLAGTGYAAQDVIDAFNNTTLGATPTDAEIANMAKMKELQAMFSLTGLDGAGTTGNVFLESDITANAAGTGTKTLSYSGALQGGTDGNTVVTTAKELMDFINNDATLSKLFEASLANNSQTGGGVLSVFDEVAYYGCPYDETGLQFLGPADSTNIEFATNGANQELSITWEPDAIGDATANLAAYNANASLSLEVLKNDDQYDDMAVRFKRVVQADAASSVTYTSGPSTAIAYGSISSDDTDINAKFIFEALEGGERFNNLEIKAQVDGTQSAAATFSLNESTGEFMITVNSTDVTLADMIDAFNQSAYAGTFKFELDYSDAGATTNDGSAKFSEIIKSNGQIVTLGNTGSTGGHTGGVLEITLYDDPANADDMTAQAVVDLVNNSALSDTFRMNNYAGSDGTGQIHARNDTVGNAYDPQNCSGDTTNYRMITTGGVEKGKMVINLATDASGNSITTAADLVAYFDTLSAEETKGISVSLIMAGGGEADPCGVNGGNGVLLPTSSYDDCYNLIENDIVFGSSCSETKDSTALSEIVANNGADAGFTLFSKTAGTDYEGIKLVYENVSNIDDMGASYDANSKTLTVKIQDNVTTASQVKSMIENTGLFTVQLRTTGSGAVTVNDNSVSLTNGSYDTTPKGGAQLLWNADDTSSELYLESVETGSDQFVQIDTISGNFSTVDSYTGQSVSRSYGTDIEATANGQKLQSTGNKVSLNTTNLSFSATINDNAEAGDSYSFDIVSGGALFQLGPDVVSSQQIRLGIPSVMTSDLGGSYGKLSDLRSGGSADLSSDASIKIADRIVKDAITAVSSTRGRLGAIQKATLESNMTTLENSIEALTSARSDIIDTDFAEESSNLTKYQILMQSGSTVLALANQLPQYAAQLIG